MFRLFRSRRQLIRIFLGVVVGVFVISLVVTLIPGFGTSSGSGGDVVLAAVDGVEITARQAQSEIEQAMRQKRLPSVAYNLIAPQVVQNLITDQMLLQESERMGLHVTEEELADLLHANLPYLSGPDARERYEFDIRQRFQLTVPEFEADTRQVVAINKLRRLVTDNVTVSEQEVGQEFSRRNERVRVQFVSISPGSLAASITPAPAEIEEHFQKNRGNYMLPERRSFKYMVIDQAKTAAAIEIKPGELERYYNENRDRFRVQDRARVTHILFKTTDKKDDEIKKIEAKAQDVLKQIRAGKDFAALAKEHSEDTANASKGGEIGWITRGQTVPEFEQKAFAMKPGEITDVVKTPYGFHIIKLLERDQARLKTLAEVEPVVREELARDRGELERARLADRARATALKHGVNLEAAGREVGLPVYAATLVERGKPIPEVGSEIALMDSLFAAGKGVVVGPVQTATKTVIAVVTEVAPSRQGELAEVRDRVRSDVAAAKSRQAAEARGREVLEKAKSAGGDLEKAAKALKLEVKTSEPFTRDGSVPGLGAAAMLREAFTAETGQVLGPVAAGVDYIVYKVTERIPADPSVRPDEQHFIREGLRSTRQNEVFEIYKEELRERLKKQGKIKIYQDRLERFASSRR